MTVKSPQKEFYEKNTRVEPLVPLGYQQITSLSSAASLTVPTGARVAKIVAEGTDVRWRDDGTSPTTTVGMLIDISVDPYLTYEGDLSAIEFIETAASATLSVSYYS